jgi:hypothetical protein
MIKNIKLIYHILGMILLILIIIFISLNIVGIKIGTHVAWFGYNQIQCVAQQGEFGADGSICHRPSLFYIK